MKEAEIEQTKFPSRQNYAIVLSEYRIIKAISCANFSGKIWLLFVLFWLFLLRKRRGHMLKVWNQNFRKTILPTIFPGYWIWKGFGPTISWSWAFWYERSFFLISKCFFKFGCFCRYHTHFLEKNQLDFTMQNFILSQLTPVSDFKN